MSESTDETSYSQEELEARQLDRCNDIYFGTPEAKQLSTTGKKGEIK